MARNSLTLLPRSHDALDKRQRETLLYATAAAPLDQVRVRKVSPRPRGYKAGTSGTLHYPTRLTETGVTGNRKPRRTYKVRSMFAAQLSYPPRPTQPPFEIRRSEPINAALDRMAQEHYRERNPR